MALGHGVSTVTDALILHLDAANKRSYSGAGTTWNDLTTNVNNCSLFNGTTYSSTNNGYFSFDGTNDMGVLPNTLKWSANGSIGFQTMTIDMWVNSSDTAGKLISKPWNGSGEYNYWIDPSHFRLVATSGANQINFARNVCNGTWTNIVCWMNSTNFGYYINGNEFSGSNTHGLTGAAASVGDANISCALMTLYPYGDAWAGNANFSTLGNLATCKIYSRVLSSNEVLKNFNALRGRYGV
jgi:hypothetical protein